MPAIKKAALQNTASQVLLRFEIPPQLLDVTHARVSNLLARDLLERADRDTAFLGNKRPPTLGGGKLLHHEFVLGFHGSILGPILGFVNPL